jgi:hypothetical protein
MGRWTPLILMTGGFAILMGTLLGINFPIGGQQVGRNDDPEGRTSRVLPANINVNSSSGSSGSGNNTASDNRGRVAQDNFSTPNTNVAQSNDSPSTSDTPSGTRSTGFQSDTVNQDRTPIRALW